MLDEPHTTSMISFLPQNDFEFKRLGVKFPHMTLVFAGEIDAPDAPTFKELALAGSHIAYTINTFPLYAGGLQTFGEAPDEVRVLRLHQSILLSGIRRSVEHFNRSEYKTYQPHITLENSPGEGDPAEIAEFANRVSRDYILFTRLVVSHGEDHLEIGLAP